MRPPALAIQQANDATPGTVPRIPAGGKILQANTAGTGAEWVDPSAVSGGGGSAIPAPALVATSNITLSGVQTVDGVATDTLAAGAAVLAAFQTNQADRNYWIPNAGGAWALASYANTDPLVAALFGQSGAAVTGGATGVGSVWFLSSGKTLGAAKTWSKLTTPALLQDTLGTTLPAQTLTQHKGAAIIKDPANGRNSIDHDRRDIREFGANPNGSQQTTATAADLSGAITLGGAITGLAVGNWLMLHQLGAAHGMSTPAAPQVIAQGTTGARTVSIKFVAVTSTHGYTAAGPATTIANANAAIGVVGADFEYLTYVEAWPAAVPGAYKYLAYAQFDGSGSYSYVGAVIAYPLFDADGNAFPMSLRLVTTTLPTPPEGIPATAPASAVPNGLRSQVTAIATSTTITVSPVPITTGTTKVATLCNKLPIEDAMQAVAFGYGAETRVPFGTFYCTGDVEFDCPGRFTGSNAGRVQAASIILFRDGHGAFGCNYVQGVQRQPGTLYRRGDRVVASLRNGVLGCWTATAIAGGKPWGVSGTGGDPTWNYTTGATTTDGEITWTFASTAYLTSANGAKIEYVAFRAAGLTIPAQRHYAPNDLRLSQRGLGAAVFIVSHAYTAGQYVIPTVANQTGKAYLCTTPGTSAGTEAVWGRTNGGTTTQGAAVFTCVDMRVVQGAGVLAMVPIHFEYCQARDFGGTGVFMEGNSYSNGGAINMSRARGWDIRGNTGHGMVVQGADGNCVSVGDSTIGVRTGLNSGACSVQDNSFYGTILENVVSDGSQRFQNQPVGFNSVQSTSRLNCCYTEGNAPGDADWNYPGVIEGGNLRVRPTATGILRAFGESLSTVGNSSIYEVDAVVSASVRIQRVLNSGFERKLMGDPTTGTVVAGTLLQEEDGGFTVDGRTYTKILNGAYVTRARDHYGARGFCEIYPLGIRLGAGGFTTEAFVTSVSAVPTAGLFKPGDVYFWAGDNRRLAVLVSRVGNLTGAARANSTAYVRGDIVTSGGQSFRCTIAGTSSGSLPAAFASASAGTQVNDGTALFHCWGTAQDPLLYALPNWSVPSVAIADGNYQTTSGLAGSAGPVFALGAATANRTIDVLTAGAIAGDGVEFINNNDVAFTWTLNSGSGGSAIITLPANTPCKVRLRYSGAAWTVDSFQLVGASPRLNPIRTVAGTTDTPTAADQATRVTAANAALTTFTLNSMPAGTAIPFYGTGAGGYAFANGTATVETAIASSGAAAQYGARLAFWRTTTNVSIT